MGVVSAYKEVVTGIKQAIFGVEVDGFRIERDEYYSPDLVYTLDTPHWNAQAKYIPYLDKPEQITYSLSKLHQTYAVDVESDVEDELVNFLTYYHIVELEELTHCMGEIDCAPDHSKRWIPFLADKVISHTSDCDSITVRFEER